MTNKYNIVMFCLSLILIMNVECSNQLSTISQESSSSKNVNKDCPCMPGIAQRDPHVPYPYKTTYFKKVFKLNDEVEITKGSHAKSQGVVVSITETHGGGWSFYGKCLEHDAQKFSEKHGIAITQEQVDDCKKTIEEFEEKFPTGVFIDTDDEGCLKKSEERVTYTINGKGEKSEFKERPGNVALWVKFLGGMKGGGVFHDSFADFKRSSQAGSLKEK